MLSDGGHSFVYLASLLRLLVAALLLISAIGKLIDITGWQNLLHSYHFRPVLIGFLTFTIPGVELLLGGWLAFGDPNLDIVAAVAAALFFVFSLFLGKQVLDGNRAECGCFGRLASSRVTWVTVVRNLLFSVMAGTVAIWPEETIAYGTGLVAPLSIVAVTVCWALILEIVAVFTQAPRHGSR